MAGSDSQGAAGVYGTQGVPSPANTPGARRLFEAWVNPAGKLMLFGGRSPMNDRFNDVWTFDGTNWAWTAGPSTPNGTGVYGTRGVPSPANFPGGRGLTGSARGPAGTFWLFGGSGGGFCNDLWRWDGTYWTRIAGGNAYYQAGVCGTLRVPSPSNVPGGREGARMWIDPSGSLWIMGGSGLDATPPGLGLLNDLWRYAP